MNLKRKHANSLYWLACFFLIGVNALGQEVTLSGAIADSLGHPLSYVSVFAYPEGDAAVVYDISNLEGHYTLQLVPHQTYTLTISHLGYKKQNISIQIAEDGIKNIALAKQTESLETVTLTYTPPVVVKQDTVIYQVEAFTSGNERKLRDILDKLPALEVDKAGNVTYQGKRITKVMVENKQFFTGDSKLAVNNLPADAVKEVQVLENYNEISFLKNLENSNEIALNIGLKEDKKRFIFGDIAVGGGLKEHYLIHPALYYYSPQTSINFIGDLNNTGQRAFSMKDYINLERDQQQLIFDMQSYSSVNTDLIQFISNRAFTASQTKFGAFNITQTLDKHTTLSSYIISTATKNQTHSSFSNTYTANAGLFENRTTQGHLKNQFTLGKLKLRYRPDDYTDFSVESYLKLADNFKNDKVISASSQDLTQLNTRSTLDNIAFKQHLNWHKQFDEDHTLSVMGNYSYHQANPYKNWLTDQPFLEELLPLIPDSKYHIFKDKSTKTQAFTLFGKYYWVLNRFNHLYFTVGTQFTFDDYYTLEGQELASGETKDFSSAGFGNNTDLFFNDNYMGIQYKRQLGIVIIKPGLYAHNYSWRITQHDSLTRYHKTLLLPEAEIEVPFKDSKTLHITYNLKARFPSITQLANRYTLRNFNALYRGNQDLQNELFHQFSARFYSLEFFKSLFYNASIRYTSQARSIQNTTRSEGINLITSPILLHNADESWDFSAGINKKINDYELSLQMRYGLSDYKSVVNQNITTTKANTYSTNFKVKTDFDKGPNLALEYHFSLRKYDGLEKSQFNTHSLSSDLEYDFLKVFTLKMHYAYELYNNKTAHNTDQFHIGDVSLTYHKASSPWLVELSANNLFDIRYRRRNTYSEVLISDFKTYIMPRVLLLKVAYKL